MRSLTIDEIRQYADRQGVRRNAVVNFLATMGNDPNAAEANLEMDAKSYRWEVATVRAISDGINHARYR